jgi:pantoate--beta-alanine ligase
MELIETIERFRKALDSERAVGRTVGLVPTMGYLHDGHVSLMRRAASECDVVAATIFVNPLQFAANEDLSTYPRELDGDRALAEANGVEYLFVPSTEEMYGAPSESERSGDETRGPDRVLTSVNVAEVSEGLEAGTRPTHFAGVATVVAKLFNIAGPCRAYFGEKDWQQLQVVRRMVTDLSFPVDVVGCPTVREPDGLAMSSRNAYLTAEERAAAPVLYRALQAGASDVANAHTRMAEVFATEPLVALDYADVVETDTEFRLLVAARLGRTRLIDNIGVPT